MEITYRKLQILDIEAYHKVRLQCLQDHPDGFGSTYEEESKKQTFKFDPYLKTEDPENFLMGAFQAGNCIGICGFIREQGKRTRHRGHLVQIYVQNTFQGKGIGKSLIEKTTSIAFEELGVEQILLGVVTNNKEANNLYEKLGFKEYGMMKSFLKLNDRYLDKRLMVKFKQAHKK